MQSTNFQAAATAVTVGKKNTTESKKKAEKNVPSTMNI